VDSDGNIEGQVGCSLEQLYIKVHKKDGVTMDTVGEKLKTLPPFQPEDHGFTVSALSVGKH